MRKILLFTMLVSFFLLACSDGEKKNVTKEQVSKEIKKEDVAKEQQKTTATNFKPKPIGKIAKIKGVVKINRNNKTIKGANDSDIYNNDVITTEKESFARILFSDNTSVAIGNRSEFSVKDYFYSQKEAKANYSVVKGSFEVITGGIGKISPDKFKLKVGTATIGIRGTRIVGDVFSPKSMTIGCVDGRIDVVADGKKQFIKENKRVQIKSLDDENSINLDSGQMVKFMEEEEFVAPEDITKTKFISILEDVGVIKSEAISIVEKHVKLLSRTPKVNKDYENKRYEVFTALEEKEAKEAKYSLSNFSGNANVKLDDSTGRIIIDPTDAQSRIFEFTVEAKHNSTSESRRFKVDVGGFLLHKSYDVGRNFLVYVDRNGYLWGAGRNDYGQLGNKTKVVEEAVLLSEEGGWSSVYAGAYHIIAKKDDGTIWGIGRNLNGELGLGTFRNVNKLTKISNDKDWQQISTGKYYTMAIKNNGSLWGWGDNQGGKLGNSGGDNESKPIRIGRSNDWKKVSTGDNHVIALKSDGTIWGWGRNDFGQLGVDNILLSNRPYLISKKIFRDISAGGSYSTAIDKDRKLWAWGVNDNGQLGDGTFHNRSTPYLVSDQEWEEVYCGSNHTIARRADNTLWGWGDNKYNQLVSKTNENKILEPMNLNKQSSRIAMVPMKDSTFTVDKKGNISIIGKLKKDNIKTYDYLVAEWIKE